MAWGSRGVNPLGLNRGSSSKCQARKLLKDLPSIYVEEGSQGLEVPGKVGILFHRME